LQKYALFFIFQNNLCKIFDIVSIFKYYLLFNQKGFYILTSTLPFGVGRAST